MIVQLRNISLKLNNHIILKNINLDLEKNKIFALVGKNGAGKTTFLRILSSEFTPFLGEGRINGYDIYDKISVKNNIHYVDVNNIFYEQLTAKENIIFALNMHSKKFNQSEFEDIMEKFQLIKHQDKYLKIYSAGMRKKLSLVRAFLLAKPLTLLDEPFANLDKQSKITAFTTLKDLNQKSTLIVAAHEKEIFDIADKNLLVENMNVKFI